MKQEESKQDWYCPKCQSYVSSESVTFEETHQLCNTSVIILEHKQETLLQIAVRKLMSNDWLNGAEFGAKWQQERSYSEEEVLVLLHKRDAYNFETNAKSLQEWETPKEWFEQFKNK